MKRGYDGRGRQDVLCHWLSNVNDNEGDKMR